VNLKNLQKVINNLGYYPVAVRLARNRDAIVIEFDDRWMEIDQCILLRIEHNAGAFVGLLDNELTDLHKPEFADRMKRVTQVANDL
jgi:hypothetical protein